MTAVAFIGLGVMGSPMAVNLVRAGHRVTGFTRTRPRGDALVSAGGSLGETAADVVRDADVVITMLPDSADVESVALGADGVLSAMREGSLFVDMSSVQPETARMIARAARERGIDSLDAPVSGGERGAVDGTLSIMVGGDATVVERAAPIFDALGSSAIHVGPSGAGQLVKAANQLVVAGTIELVSEAIMLMDGHGIDAAAGLRVLAGGLAGSRVLELKAQTLLARDYRPGFRAALHHKDLGIVIQSAREVGASIPLGMLVAHLMSSLVASGRGDLDHTALLQLAEELSGNAQSALIV